MSDDRGKIFTSEKYTLNTALEAVCNMLLYLLISSTVNGIYLFYYYFVETLPDIIHSLLIRLPGNGKKCGQIRVVVADPHLFIDNV